MFFTHDPWTRDASGMPERFAEELSPRKKDRPLPRKEKVQSWCESTGQWELRSRKRNRNELRIYVSCAPCEHGRAQDGWECWSMGHPCSIQRGLARRLCILLVCTDPISVLALSTETLVPATSPEPIKSSYCMGVFFVRSYTSYFQHTLSQMARNREPRHMERSS